MPYVKIGGQSTVNDCELGPGTVRNQVSLCDMSIHHKRGLQLQYLSPPETHAFSIPFHDNAYEEVLV